MEPSITPPPEEVPKPLSELQVIGNNTYLWTSPLYSYTTASSAPLILLFGWNAAGAKHIAKYTLAYQKLFPASRILLIRCFTTDMIFPSLSYAKLRKPAIDVVHEHTKSNGELLVHSFSNGGANQLNKPARVWQQQYGTMLPMRAQILDSSPTKGAWMRAHAAISASLPNTLFSRIFGSAMIHLTFLCLFIVDTILWRERENISICKDLNNDTLYDKRVPRVYLYSRVDTMVGFEEADEHANLAKEKGWDVTKVIFDKSPHCAHIREDSAKYWAAIMEAWKRGPTKS